ncbi:MAG: glucose-6-phosphate isomerase [Pseudomonadota bacterium]
MSNAYVNRTLSARYPTDLPAWQRLVHHHRDEIRHRELKYMFARDKKRAQEFMIKAGDLHFDYSKNHLNRKTRGLLAKLAEQADVKAAIEAMFSGELINQTEGRAVLHTALRATPRDRVGKGVDGVSEVWKVLDRIEGFVNAVHDGAVAGSSGKRFTDVVNIGIGGSDLGPVMASRALREYWVEGLAFHSVSNVDGTQLADLVRELDPETTLFVICSKTFTTLETMANAKAARTWIRKQLGAAAIESHFVAASTNHDAMNAFGIHPEYRFGFWDWVGGRYSLWSAVGLSLALVIGMHNFRRMLAGGRAMDKHFQKAPLAENMPVLMALIGIWYNNFFDSESHAILPYDNRLDRFPAYLQQLQMESSGKRVRMDGKPVRCATGMVIWGEAGNNAQHSFYQLLHQGTRLTPADFILPIRSSGATQAQQDLAIANCLAQSEALMDGFSGRGVESYRTHPGNRPSSTILFPELTPEVLGQLIAAYEHKVFVEGVIWGIDSFDQWGVELGKKLASSLEAAAAQKSKYEGKNDSTAEMLRRIRRLR